MTPLDPTDLVDLYWGGRVSLVTRGDDIVVYDRVFKEFFLDAGNPVQDLVKIEARAEPEAETVLEIPAVDPGAEEPDEETVLGLMASDAETLKRKSFAACTDGELEALRRIMARIRLTPPRRRTRRSRPARRGRRPDLRATIRRSLRMHGEMVDLHWRRRRLRLRPLILILDISGSMADYSRALLQFAYSAKRASAKVEVFCFGTRLTHLTASLETRKPDDALERAAGLVVDWEGGTRIGESLDAFVRHWGRRGMARGGIVVICSDGLDRGDPDVLATAMERLSRLSHRIVWMNPHKQNNANYRPQTVAMMVADPHIDLLLSGHDLSSLEELADLLPELG
ncbi:VWA domain-containing protein [Pseudonocardia bannensis]|uniref:VWA domain-containing protein n=2 Tax=Pseudonocardia bannensis TaxID=630973 RepID=A0A848DG63_9PSEU|nr:VWA domain-containing protein [Pseudonocardia bannensis]